MIDLKIDDGSKRVFGGLFEEVFKTILDSTGFVEGKDYVKTKKFQKKAHPITGFGITIFGITRGLVYGFEQQSVNSFIEFETEVREKILGEVKQ